MFWFSVECDENVDVLAISQRLEKSQQKQNKIN